MAADPKVIKRRCAVYTRKSSEEGLEQAFNSLDAQREAGLAYIASQRAEGWIALPDRYDDGGVSGGTLDRPALKRLLRDIESGLVDVVVVYKIDRLSRSLIDFAKLIDVFERSSVTFISITQQFCTTNSLGRLTLNILLSFAQFEREVIAERIRDKFAASRRKGMWMGGYVPLGYRVDDRKLVVVETETELVHRIVTRFAALGSALHVARELNTAGEVTKRRTTAGGGSRGGLPWTKGGVYKILANRVYLGEAVHKGKAYPGEHEAIVVPDLWDRVHAILGEHPRKRAATTRAAVPMLLKGLIFGPAGRPMSPSHTRRRGRVYRYYVAREAIAEGYASAAITSVPAGDVEAAVLAQVQRLLTAPEMIARTARALQAAGEAVEPSEAAGLLADFGAVWAELFPAEQARIVRLLVERVDVQEDGIEVRLRAEGLASLLAERGPSGGSSRAAA